MKPTARVNLDDLGKLFDWLFSQWWVYVILGAIVLFVIVVMVMPASKVKGNPQFSETDTGANEVALGYLQTQNVPSGAWNDPTASGLTAANKTHLAQMWGLDSREDWLANIERLAVGRRQRPEWVAMLDIRTQLGQAQGRAPKSRDWINAIMAAGIDKKTARDFAYGIESLENEVRKKVGKDIVTPDLYVKTLDGYAFGQAVAMATWGVAMGHGTQDEARGIIHQINVDARPAFTSWADFGLSYIVGRVMHWGDGVVDEKTFAKYGDGCNDFAAAATAKRNGPWATLPWRI